jgi:hypothetical protein
MAWNPAGLGALRTSQVAVDGFTRSSTGDARGLPSTLVIPGFGDFGIGGYSTVLGSVNGFGFFGAATPLVALGGRPLVGGAAYRRHTDVAYGQENLIEMVNLQTTSGFPLSLGVDSEERGFIESYTVGLGYGWMVSPGLDFSVGATANLLSGRLRSSTMTRVAVRNFEEGRGKYQQDYKGFSAELGAQARLGSMLRVGGWVSLPHTIEVYNGRIVDKPIVSPDQFFSYRFHWEVADYDLEIPLFATVGAALGPFRGVEISADYNHRPWSETEIKHHDVEFQQLDGAYPAADVTSFHIGGRFEFPLLRKAIRGAGMKLTTLVGYRDMPLSMQEVDLGCYEDCDTLGLCIPVCPDTTNAPFYRGSQVEGSATTFGFELDTGRNVTFSLGLELRSYDYTMWFMNDARELGTLEEPGRDLWFEEEAQRVMTISRDETIMRFGARLNF